MYASVSHELRTPINIIMNCLRCLMPESLLKQKKWIKIADAACSMLLSLVNDTLDFA